LIALDGAPQAGPLSRNDTSTLPLPEALAELTSEYFVEWQVADHGTARSPASTLEK
jgi:hypothetical protein